MASVLVMDHPRARTASSRRFAPEVVVFIILSFFGMV
jgi:hypothetical protein